MRDIPGFLDTRKKILDSKPSLRQNWITYVVANFVAGQYKAADEVIKKYRETITKKDQFEGYEESELLLFQNKCYEFDGRLDVALTHLEANQKDIVDKHSYNIKHAELLLKLGRFEEAKAEWLTLITNHPENYRFHSGFQAAHLQLGAEQCIAALALKRLELPSTEFNLTSEQLASLRAAYDETKIKPKVLRRLYLSLYRPTDAGFQEQLSSYIQAALKDGLPALYHDVCALFRIPDVANPSRLIFTKDAYELSQHSVFQFVFELIQTYIRNLKEHQQFYAPSSTPANGSELPELPSALLWSLFLYCHLLELKGDLTEAIKVIDECIAHTPTGIDMYSKKARLLKKQGDLLGAAVQMDECRALDLQDRYLNNKATKYFLRADEMNQAMNTIAMFTKHDGDPQKILYDLQCNWYELEAAESYARSKQWGQALKKFYAVKKHFNDHYDDMFDFHGYCIRKNTLRAYNDILIMQDNSYTHKFYQRATRGVLRIFLHLLECPEDIDGLGHLSPADRKKERARIKKLKDKEKKEAEDKTKAEEEDKKWNSNPNKAEEEEEAESKKDPDPTGELLLTRDFQAEAAVWCGFFTDRMAGLDSETLALVCEIQMRRGKYLQVVRALSVGLKKDPLSPELNVMLVKVVLKMKAPSGKRPTLHSTTATIVREELSALLHSTDGLALGAYVTKYSEKCKELHSLPHTIGAARCLYLNDKSAPTVQAIAALISDPSVWTGRGIQYSNVAAALKVRMLFGFTYLDLLSIAGTTSHVAHGSICGRVQDPGCGSFPHCHHFPVIGEG